MKRIYSYWFNFHLDGCNIQTLELEHCQQSVRNVYHSRRQKVFIQWWPIKSGKLVVFFIASFICQRKSEDAKIVHGMWERFHIMFLVAFSLWTYLPEGCKSVMCRFGTRFIRLGTISPETFNILVNPASSNLAIIETWNLESMPCTVTWSIRLELYCTVYTLLETYRPTGLNEL